MSLEDRTNENIRLSLHHGEHITVDLDSDSSFDPPAWINVYSDAGNQDFHFNMTFEEAELFRDRLNLILGVDNSDDLE